MHERVMRTFDIYYINKNLMFPKFSENLMIWMACL
jgi:hypothetical protein